jgi:hypothetical protein
MHAVQYQALLLLMLVYDLAALLPWLDRLDRHL